MRASDAATSESSRILNVPDGDPPVVIMPSKVTSDSSVVLFDPVAFAERETPRSAIPNDMALKLEGAITRHALGATMPEGHTTPT